MRYAPKRLWFAWFFLLTLLIPIKIEAKGAAHASPSASASGSSARLAAATPNSVIPSELVGAKNPSSIPDDEADEVKKGAIEPWERQMVWITYAEGDVRLSPGQNDRTKLGKDWLEANVGQVMEDGYSLVTGKGRAEIEFEDGTVVYLAEHSVLEFDSLWVKGTEYSTEISLPTGMVTVSHSSSLPGYKSSDNRLLLATPAARVVFDEKTTLRVEAALDGVRMKELEGEHDIWRPNRLFGLVTLEPGDEVFIQGHRLTFIESREPLYGDDSKNFWKIAGAPETAEEKAAKEWDAWVMDRETKRDALIAEGLKESGMKEPLPGLAGMMENGNFFDCAPYGKCWQPNPVAESAMTGVTSHAAGPGAMDVASPAFQQVPGAQDTQGAAQGTSRDANAPGNRRGQILVNQTMTSRCPLETWKVTRVAQGKQHAQLVQYGYGPCLAGSWDYSNYRADDPCTPPPIWQGLVPSPCPNYFYSSGVWVPGHRHHHECHYVKGHGHAIGFVARNPLDKPGRPPGNVKAGIMVLTAKDGKVGAGLVAAPSKGVQVETRTPGGEERSIAKAGLQSAARVGQPEIQAKMAAEILPEGLLGANAKHTAAVGTVRFDYKSGNFVGKTGGGVAGSSGGHSVVVAHSGGGGGGVGGGGSHGGGGGGGAGGGGGHAGGGGSSGGGSSGGGGGGGGGHH